MMLRTILLFMLFASVSAAEELTLEVRTRIETKPKSGQHHAVTQTRVVTPAKAALIICDMWDAHGCPSAAARVEELAPRIQDFAVAARKLGLLVIHCPSDCMKFYDGTPQRKRAQAAPKAATTVPLERWCKPDPAREGKLPIDDSDDGCEEPLTANAPWTRQHKAIQIADNDAISDSEEVYHLLRQRGIDTVLICGVHANRCVLGRPFGIRQLVRQGLNVLLVRDLTDSMYSGKTKPFVSHFTGTDLTIEHIEKHWCGTILSSQLLGGKEFRFKADTRPTITMLIGEDEYKTEKTLPAFALTDLGQDFRVNAVFADAKDKTRMIGLDALSSTDVLLLSMRRRPLVQDQLALIRKFIENGMPLVGIRTASHAFAPAKGQKLASGLAEWTTFDRDILGCHYTGHAAHKQGTVIEAKSDHAVLKGFANYQSNSGVYRSSPLAPDCVLLLSGTSGDITEPVAWLREKSGNRGRVFYAALGHESDFAQAGFRTLLAQGCRWAAGK